MKIPFNKPFMIGKEIEYMADAINSGKISGDGIYTRKCHSYFEETFGFKKVLLTSSCTDALEMCALLAGITAGDEVIMPSYTFVSTANAFVLRGAKIVFADSMASLPNIDVEKIEELITPRTKAIVVVHYGGVACQMAEVMAIAKKHGLLLIEDAAQAIDSYYNKIPLGSFGELAAFSFHETKNVISGEGGMIAVNENSFVKRAEIVREKGTNRSAFFRGEVDKYNWVDIGSSFLPSELTAAFLYAQLENLELIQNKRKQIWNRYNQRLKALESKGRISLPVIPGYATNNGHLFYILTADIEERTRLAEFLKKNDILSVFHYLSLHKSPYYQPKHDGRELANSDRYSECLLRLPLYYELALDDVDMIADKIEEYYKTN